MSNAWANVESFAREKFNKSETIKLRNKHIGQACQLFYQTDPIKIVRGQGQYMYDEKGTCYLDCINNVAHVGHCHPQVVKAGVLQMTMISTNNRFLHDELVQCAQTLTNTMPEPLSVCFFVNSGSEANDLALRLARNYTKCQDIITLDHAYHGHLTSVMEISPYKFNQFGGDTKPDYIHVVPCPDSYGGVFKDKNYKNCDMAEIYAKPLKDLCDNFKLQEKRVAAFIAESLQSCGGQIIPPKGYFKKVFKAIREVGGVCIMDEVQVGFGRVGSHYWAFELQDIVPDIVTVAKPMGNGHPIGAVITTPEIANAFYKTGVSYFNTYGGNPVSCAIANAVMRVIDEEGLQKNAQVVGDYLLQKCHELSTEFPIIGHVRGVGLFVGIELVKNRETREPDGHSTNCIVNRMKEYHHILISSDGPNKNVIKLKPPMCFNIENANEFVTCLRECLHHLQKQKSGEVQITNSANTANSAKMELLSNASQIFEHRDHLIKSL